MEEEVKRSPRFGKRQGQKGLGRGPEAQKRHEEAQKRPGRGPGAQKRSEAGL